MFSSTGRCRASITDGRPGGDAGAQGKPQPDDTADGNWRERTRNLSGRTTGRARLTGRKDRVTAAAKRTLASTPARLRWMHGTARHNAEAAEWKTIRTWPSGHVRVMRSRRRHPYSGGNRTSNGMTTKPPRERNDHTDTPSCQSYFKLNFTGTMIFHGNIQAVPQAPL